MTGNMIRNLIGIGTVVVLVGAVAALLLLARAHDRSMGKVIGKPLISANQR